MSKAILIVDMPETCKRCKLSASAYGGDIVIDYCSALLDNDEIINKEEKLKNCPLKPMPEKKFVNENFLRVAVSQEYDLEIGYNQCLDDILGGSHE